MDLNKAMIIGRLTRDPELRTTPNGTPVATFAMATNSVWTDQSGTKQEKAEFHNIVVWKRLAEICQQYLKKGAKIYVEGRIQTRDYLDQATGSKKYFTEIVAENLIMLDTKTGGNVGGAYVPGGQAQGYVPQQQGYGSARQATNMDDNYTIQAEVNPQEEEIKIENIPF